MKKAIAVMCLAMVAVGSQAGLVSWSSQLAVIDDNGLTSGLPEAATLTGDAAAGAGWEYNLVNIDTGSIFSGDALAAIVSYGWYDSNGGYLLGGYSFSADEGATVAMQVFNSDSSWSITSSSVLLPTVGSTPAPGSTDVNFDFSASDWQVVPEPATIGLMGVAGLGMFLARKKTRR
jgi:hypothetical protein